MMLYIVCYKTWCRLTFIIVPNPPNVLCNTCSRFYLIQRGLVNQLKDDMERLYQQIQAQMVSINYRYSNQIPVLYA